jgi:hypothetical protein
MDLPLTLRVLRRWPDKLRVVAMDDLGNTLFHFLRVQGTTTLVHCAKPIPLALVTEGTAGDLELWLLDGPHPADYPVRHDAGAGLLRHLGDYSTLHWMSAAGASIDRIAHGRGGGLESLLALEWREQRPHSARIVNHRLSYELDVDVREWSAEELGLEQFDPPAGQPR